VLGLPTMNITRIQTNDLFGRTTQRPTTGTTTDYSPLWIRLIPIDRIERICLCANPAFNFLAAAIFKQWKPGVSHWTNRLACSQQTELLGTPPPLERVPPCWYACNRDFFCRTEKKPARKKDTSSLHFDGVISKIFFLINHPFF
jgi:hypothetical protein